MPQLAHRRRPGELAFGYLALLVSMFLFSQAYAIDGFSSISSAGVFPLAAASVMIVTSLVTILRTHRMDHPTEDVPVSQAFMREVTPWDVIVFAGLTAAYAAAMAPLGFVPSSFLFLASAMLYLRRGGILVALGVSALTLGLVYLIFRVVFEVILPKGWLFQ